MTDLAALDALIEAVTAGDRVKLNRTMADIGYPSEAWPWDWMSRVDASFTGSLDAAKALHEALLPEWAWSIEVANVAEVWPLHKASVAVRVFADEATPARAWLLAILKAYRAGL